ncbi:MAG: MBL fold metallo-hydrolase [Myxococcales bacterium]|nr:MBL fold metallo-hydrolase [Myxococcales bacterium]
MRVIVLASGSGGNALIVEQAGRPSSRLLIDAGLPPRVMRKRYQAATGAALEAMDGVLITHGHGDHIRHAEACGRAFGAPVWMTRPALARLQRRAPGLEAQGWLRSFEAGERLQMGAFRVRTLPTPHDEPQVAVIVEGAERRLGLATDLGEVPAALEEALRACDTVLLESNHDLEMLRRGPYPPFLKERVAGGYGHLSNQQAATLLGSMGEKLERVLLMHISARNNTHERALREANRALEGRGLSIQAASQDQPLLLPLR